MRICGGGGSASLARLSVAVEPEDEPLGLAGLRLEVPLEVVLVLRREGGVREDVGWIRPLERVGDGAERRAIGGSARLGDDHLHRFGEVQEDLRVDAAPAVEGLVIVLHVLRREGKVSHVRKSQD